MKRNIVTAFTVLGLAAGHLFAVEPDWGSLAYTAHSAYQAVDGSGTGTFPLDAPVKLRGVLLNRSAAMLNGTAGTPGFLGAQWQVYVQADQPSDFGGTACYLGQYYGNFPFNPPEESYSDAEWNDEVDRVTHDPDSDRLFQPGDVVEIRARAPGLFFNGKTNVNEQHLKDPEFDFDIVLLEADRGLPTPTLITLADVKDGSDDFIFDATRASGGEQYQGSLVRINGVEIVESTWSADGTVTITDGVNTFPLKLGLGAGFDLYAPPVGPIDIVAIFDQEDGTSGGIAGYRLWVTRDYDDNGWIVGGPSGDFDADGALTDADYAMFADCMAGPSVAPAPAFASISACREAFDFDMDRDIDLDDFATFQEHFE
ncbi:MAG: hypothetical protein H6817_03385 [Phycisphaerales bacterium]|nr:hypothetical protein [Phycisphaerales bacterium]